MSWWVSGSIVVSAVVSGVAANKASKQAATAAKDAAAIQAAQQQKGLEWQQQAYGLFMAKPSWLWR